MFKVNIAGATGYTGYELVRLLWNHPGVELNALTSETYAGKTMDEAFPSLKGFCDRPLAALDASIAETCDVLFLALPHTVVMGKMAEFLKGACKIIDLSADFRIHDPETYEEWYRTPHLQPDLLDQAVYGLPELHREQIKSARLVANPGCYPTSVILGLAPLMDKEWADLDSVVADSKSGVSGAGRKPNPATQFSECNESVTPYALATHRHTPEMEQELSALAGREINLTFSPHLMPMTRGMLSAIYVSLKKELDLEDLVALYKDFYKDEPFVRVMDAGSYPGTHQVVHSNFCDIGLQVDRRTGRAVIVSALDNLVKGASGQAVQNMNIMLGLDETQALNAPGRYP